MQTFDLDSLLTENVAGEQPWKEFFRVPSLSMGIYRLSAGQADKQQPHSEDEVYYILSGKAWFRAADRSQAVAPGTLIFVEREVEHRFYDISEALTVLVFFAPAEGSRAAKQATT